MFHLTIQLIQLKLNFHLISLAIKFTTSNLCVTTYQDYSETIFEIHFDILDSLF